MMLPESRQVAITTECDRKMPHPKIALATKASRKKYNVAELIG